MIPVWLILQKGISGDTEEGISCDIEEYIFYYKGILISNEYDLYYKSVIVVIPKSVTYTTKGY